MSSPLTLDDPLQLLTPDALSRACTRAGLPVPASADLLGKPVQQAHYRVEFADDAAPPHELRLAVIPGRHDPFATEAAALFHLQLVDVVPTVESFRWLPTGLFGRPAAIHPLVGGVDGLELVRVGLGERVFRDLGAALAGLRELPVADFGRRSDGHRFVPSAPDWPREVLRWAESSHARARCRGADLGDLSDRLVRAVRERLDALAEVDEFTLVHGKLTPLNLLYRTPDDLEPRVVFWPDALAGDPLVEWGSLLFLANDALAVVVDAAGGLELDAAGLARVEAYACVRCLERLEEHPDLVGAIGAPAAGRLRQTTWDMAHKLLAGEWVEGRLGRHPWTGGPSSRAAHAALRHATRSLVCSLPLTRHEARYPLSALAGGVLGAELAGTDAGAAAMDLCFRALEPLELVHDAPGTLPVVDRASWWAELVEAAVAPLRDQDRPGPCLSLALVWVLSETLGVLGEVSDAVLRGAEDLLHTLLASEARERRGASPASVLLSHGWYGLAAVRALDALSAADVVSLERGLVAQLVDAWDALDPARVVDDVRDFDATPLLKDVLAAPEASFFRPLIALSLQRLAGTGVPVDPARVVPHLTL